MTIHDRAVQIYLIQTRGDSARRHRRVHPQEQDKMSGRTRPVKHHPTRPKNVIVSRLREGVDDVPY